MTGVSFSNVVSTGADPNGERVFGELLFESQGRLNSSFHRVDPGGAKIWQPENASRKKPTPTWLVQVELRFANQTRTQNLLNRTANQS